MMRLLSILALLVSLACPSYAAASRPVAALLPSVCAPGWAMDGKVATYTPETLYKYIDGEAELYLPYGFGEAAVAMYVPPGGKGSGIVANVFRMGSLLDAFGIFASYRDPTAEQAGPGAEGFIDESQLMFYQDRYFVRIEVSGAVPGVAGALRSCAETVSRNLPPANDRPRELEFLKVPGAVPLTERYYSSGLLGHGFFGRGLTGEVTLGGQRVKSVVMLGASDEAAARIFDDYAKYLKAAGVTPEITGEKKSAVLHVIDPLYKGVVLRRSGRFVVGVTGLKEPHAGDALTALLVERLPKQWRIVEYR